MPASQTKSHKHTQPHFINIIDINVHPALIFSLPVRPG